MSAVEVEIAEEVPGNDPREPSQEEPRDSSGSDSSGPDSSQAGSARAEEPPPRSRHSNSDVEIEREVTKRQIIESVTSVLVVILYMIFTLVRDRDSGVVVIDPDDRDDWVE